MAGCTSAGASDAGFTISTDEIIRQLTEQCTDPNLALAARSFGGPQSAVFTSAAVQASGADMACLTSAYDEAGAFSASARDAFQTCLDNGDCTGVDPDIAALAMTATDAITTACVGTPLADLVGVTPQTLVERTRLDTECQIAAGNPNLGDLSLDCAPDPIVDAIRAFEYSSGSGVEVFPSVATDDASPSMPVAYAPQRGEYVQIELNGVETGAVCGDGSNYRFWLQLAPEGFDLNNLIVFHQGGGACTLSDCAPQILAAIDIANGLGGTSRLVNTFNDNIGANGGGGLASTLNTDNPYRNWSKIHLTYCTQDIFAGGEGGAQTVNVTPPTGPAFDYEINRTGGHNARTAVAYARNVIWAAMNAEGEAYDPSAFNVFFTGSSAGGFGATFNYHFALDEMRWTNATAANLWGFGIDDLGLRGAGLRGLVDILGPLWNVGEVLAPYCQDGPCVHAEVQATRALLRMDTSRFPRQHYILNSAQVDPVQSTTTFYGGDLAGLTDWGDALRATYCRMRDAGNIPSQDNLHFFLPLTFAHALPVAEIYAPQNVTYLQWQENFESALFVADNVDMSSDIVDVGGGDMVTLAPFSCSP